MEQVTGIDGLARMLRQLQSKAQVSPRGVAKSVFGATRQEHITAVEKWLTGSALPTDLHFTLLARALHARPEEVTALQRARNRVLFNAPNDRAPTAPHPVQPAPVHPAQPSPEDAATPRTGDTGKIELPTPLTITLSSVSNARQLGEQIEALRQRANTGWVDWSHARLASEVSQGFATRKARRVVRKWLAGKVLPSWSRLRPLLLAMDASDAELTAFQDALKRVSRTANVMADPAEIVSDRRRRSDRIWTTALTCLTVFASAAATGIVLSATYAADPVQPLWKPLTVILASAALAVGARTVLYLVYDSWVPVLVLFGWLPTLLTGYALPLLTDHDYGGRAMAAAIGFL
ncbi:hypothetical protein ACH4M4_33585 [Streptomyces sp. NPDC017254]|uniref:hypothetical protein n=1 Tax=unclassified Streptomyces TaxID=2593676 RepID=UPI003787E892